MKSGRVFAAMVVGVLGLSLAGCGAAAPVRQAAPGAVAPRPVGVQDPAVIPSSSAGPAASCNPRASLRPPATMPAPKHMPAHTTMETIQARGRLIVGVDQNTYLFGYRDPSSGAIVGFDIDIAHEVARAIFGDPNQIQFVAITSAQRIPAIRSGQVDMVAETMTINCARLQQVNFSTVYFDAGQRVLVPKDSTAKGIGDLGGKKVCAAAGSTSIANIAAAASHPIPVQVNDWTDCLVMLQQGQVDAISTDNTILAGLAKQDPDTKLVGPPFTKEPYGLAISRGSPDLVSFVNGVLAQLRADGGWAKIYRKWLGDPVPQPPAAQYRS